MRGMERTRFGFERLVHRALSAIPREFRAYLENVDVIVEDWPTTVQLTAHSLTEEDLLLGLYEGVPLTERHDYVGVLPDRITIFQRSIEVICESDEQIVEEVRITLIHEVAHHFGIDDTRLHELGVA